MSGSSFLINLPDYSLQLCWGVTAAQLFSFRYWGVFLGAPFSLPLSGMTASIVLSNFKQINFE